MAISYVGSQSNAGTANVAVSYPFGWAAGDLLLLFVETGQQAVSTPTGFTALPSSPQGAGIAGNAVATRLSGFYRVAQSGDSTTVTVTDPGDHAIVLLMVYTGVDTTTPLDVNSVGGTDTDTGTTFSATGVTTVTANAWVVIAYSDGADQSAARFGGWTNANLSGLAERTEVHSSTAGNGGGLAVADGIKVSAGATGNTTGTYTTGLTNLAYLTIALRPATAASIPSSCGILIG